MRGSVRRARVAESIERRIDHDILTMVWVDLLGQHLHCMSLHRVYPDVPEGPYIVGDYWDHFPLPLASRCDSAGKRRIPVCCISRDSAASIRRKCDALAVGTARPAPSGCA